MNGFTGSIINVFFLPFRLIGYLLGLFKKPLDFISTQNKLENNYKKQRAEFFQMKRKLARDNDEII
jgi:hypothetical protein